MPDFKNRRMDRDRSKANRTKASLLRGILRITRLIYKILIIILEIIKAFLQDPS